MKKNSLFLKKSFPKLLFSVLLTGIVSCNNGNKKDESKLTTAAEMTSGNQSANAITFKEYKLDTTTIRLYENNASKAKLFLFKTRFDDLKDPSSMTLWAYPAKNHKNFAEGETPFELQPEGNPAFIDTKDIYVGDNEIALKYFHVDNNTTKPFLDFGYIVLTPYKGTKGNLVFKITPKNGNEIAPLADFPTETNPIPPGKPEEN